MTATQVLILFTTHLSKTGLGLIRSALNPFTAKICFSNNKEFPKIKMTQVSQARPELSENWYLRCQFSHLLVKYDFQFILQAQKIKNNIAYFWLSLDN